MSKIQIVCSIPIERWYTYEINVDDDYLDELVDAWGENESPTYREIVLAMYRPDLVNVRVHESVKAEEKRKYSKLLIHPETEEDYREMLWGMGNITDIHIYQPISTPTDNNQNGATTNEQV